MSLLSDHCVAKPEPLVPPASLENPPATGVRSAALGLFASVANAQDCSNAVRPPPPRACARAQLRWKAASPRLCPQNIVDDSSDSVNVADLLGLLAAYGRSGCAPCTCGGAVRARGPAPSLDCLSRWACCCTAQLPHPNSRAAPQDLDASGEVDVVDLLALLGAFGDVDCPEQCVGDSGGQIAPGEFTLSGSGCAVVDDYISITQAGVGSQRNTAFVPVLATTSDSVSSSFDFYCGDGNGADGLCWNLGANTMGGRVEEDGVATGVSVCFDEWANSGDHGVMMH